jgi:recombination protein RecA
MGDQVIGTRTKVNIVKNKLAPPFRKCEVEIIYNEGISKNGTLIDLGVNTGAITKLGTWYSCGEERIGQGKENAKAHLKEHPDIAKKIEQKIKEKYGLVSPPVEPEPGAKKVQPENTAQQAVR